MSMIKIDGEKIKRLREQQGLTQLYLATAVQVTTDTISRWENRRYPSIKKENGVKLAEALNVELEDILEEQQDKSDETNQHDSVAEEGADRETMTNEQKRSRFRRSWPLLILSLTLFTVLMAFIWYTIHSPVIEPFTAIRIMPDHFISGQLFPVLIRVKGTPGKTGSLIVKENIPQNSTIHQTSPSVTSGRIKDKQIKWLKKVNQASVFAYVISITGEEGDTVSFSGTVANTNDNESQIAGNGQATIGYHHWADSDNDNVISDKEILTVYDLYSEISDIDLNIDLIEEIWMGSGYRWDPQNKSYSILE